MEIAGIIVAVVAGGVSLLSAVYTTRLASRLEAERHARTKAEQLDELMDSYRDPLLQANAERGASCCSNQTTFPFVQPVIQERAWTSPIWYSPDS